MTVCVIRIREKWFPIFLSVFFVSRFLYSFRFFFLANIYCWKTLTVYHKLHFLSHTHTHAHAKSNVEGGRKCPFLFLLISSWCREHYWKICCMPMFVVTRRRRQPTNRNVFLYSRSWILIYGYLRAYECSTITFHHSILNGNRIDEKRVCTLQLQWNIKAGFGNIWARVKSFAIRQTVVMYRNWRVFRNALSYY